MSELKTSIKEEDFNLKELIAPYVRFLPWFILSALIFLSAAFLYIRYSSYVYRSEATILIKDTNNGALSELAAFEDLGISGAGLSKSDFENEIEILKSKRLIYQVVRKLNLNVKYYREGNVKSSEIFLNKPFFVNVVSLEDTSSYLIRSIYVKPISDKEFILKDGEDDQGRTHKFGDILKLDFGEIVINSANDSATKNDQDELNNFTLVSISNNSKAVIDLKNNLNIQAANKNSSVLKISFNSSAPNKSEAILNTLIDVYNNDAIQDRNLVSANTAKFIDRRLEIITSELDSVETKNVNFREDRNVTDIATEGQLFLQSKTELERKRLEVSTKIGLASAMNELLQNGSDNELLPVNLGLSGDGLATSIQEYNNLVLEKERLLKSSTSANPVIITLDNQLKQLRSSITSSLDNVKTSLEIEDKDLRKQSGSIGGKIAAIPSLTKAARDIMRQQEIKEALYLYLLQKREETAISLAVTTPKAKIVDRAYSLRQPISPKPKIVYLGALVLGLLIPFGIVYVKTLLDTKIHNRLDIEKALPELAILGEVPTIDSKESETITSNDRSVLAEAFRILRTNLGYFIKSSSSVNGNTIFVTSTIKGEG
ncbi:GumC family protein, partial [Dokdonia donghaensis]|uniref:GumC family protein n=1 Tax=Dokdonia donghaensis TaxID=326320 RepID=UPI0035C81BC9